MKNLLRSLVLAVLVAAPSAAFANDYISVNPNDWYRYSDSLSGQKVTSEMTQDLGGWRQWSNWGGLGTTWVYTTDSHDWFWLWNGTTYQLVNNLDGQYTGSIQADLKGCNDSDVTFGSKASLTTAAGTFNEVSRIDFTTSCADAGVTSIWFAKGVGIVRWTEMSIAGPRTFDLEAAFVDGTTYPQATTPPPNPTGTRAVAVSEHAPMETIMWGANDTYLVVPTYTDAFSALDGSGVTSTVIVASQSIASQLRYEMAQNGVPMADVEILVASLDSVWMRDYGPIVLKRPNGERVVGDPDYYPGRPNDDDLPIAYANYRGWDRVHMDLGFEGGNFATDGNGLAIYSEGVNWFNPGMSDSSIAREFAKLGCDDREVLTPLIDEGTTHVDMFMRIMDDDTALVSRYPSSHRQSSVCNAAASQLSNLGYSIVRADVEYGYDEYATYSNSVLANGIALVPQYGRSSKDSRALDVYRSLGYTAVGIDSSLIIRYSGATHCLSMQIPR